MKQKVTIFIIIIFASFLTIINDMDIKTASTISENKGFYDLGFDEKDIVFLKSKYQEDELDYIINNQINKTILFSYINIETFELHLIHEYEKLRLLHNYSPLAAVNATNHPYLISEFYKYKNEALNIDNELILVNKNYALDENYIPNNLVFAKGLRFLVDDYSRYYLKEEAYLALKELFTAAESKSLILYLSNGYRSFAKQKKIYEQYSLLYPDADLFSARAGHSEHQTGLAVDVTCKNADYLLSEKFADTEEGKFLKNNAHLFGFIERYPKDKTHITGYNYEPWHLRYVGKKAAKIIFENNLTLEEYLLEYTILPKK